MLKEFNVNGPLRKEMAELVEKRRALPFGSAEWVAINLRWNELLVLWGTSRLNNIELDMAKASQT